MIILQANGLVAALFDEMKGALQAIEDGDYDLAFDILAARCRPSDELTTISLTVDSIPSRRLAQEMKGLIPPGLVREIHAQTFEQAVHTADRALRSAAEWRAKPENLLTAISVLSDFGLTLAWDFEAGQAALESDGI